jgi:hypothetical protein
MTLAASDHDQPTSVVRAVAPGHRQRTRQANSDLNRGMVVNGEIAERAGN